METWFRTLSHKDRAKLKIHRTKRGRDGRAKWARDGGAKWARDGGSIIALGLRHGKAARRNKKLKRQREARFKAEQAAYEARRADQASIEIET
jgi:hypothetical protein